MRTISRTSIVLLGLAFLVVPAGASGITTLGQVAPNPQPLCDSGGRPILAWQDSVAASPDYVAPGEGAITSWSTNASAGAGQIYTFKVLRPLRSRRFLVVGHDGPRTLTAGQVNVFQTDIPVQPGDLLALNSENSGAVHTACVFRTPDLADAILISDGSPADGELTTFPSTPPGEERVNVSATFLPVPTITSLSPASGPPRGGSIVTVSGADFADVTGVKFGGAAATRFTVDSETQLTATAPPGEDSTQVPLTVTTVAGTATAAFSYTSATGVARGKHCVVPRLRGRKLRVARRMLKRAGCRVGRVRVARAGGAKPGRVVRQRPKPRIVLAAGGKVSLTVSGRRPRP